MSPFPFAAMQWLSQLPAGIVPWWCLLLPFAGEETDSPPGSPDTTRGSLKADSPFHPCSSISKGKVSLVGAGGGLGDPFTTRPVENSFCSFHTTYFGLFCSSVNGLFFFSPLLWRQSSFPFCHCGLCSSLQCSSFFILAFCPLSQHP